MACTRLHAQEGGLTSIISRFDDIPRVLRAVLDCCLNFLLAEPLQHQTEQVALNLADSDAALKLRTVCVCLH